MPVLALSRTCDLNDFPECYSVDQWQQLLAAVAWESWQDEHHIRTREQPLCVNWSGLTFTAPGPEAIYRFKGQSTEIERQVPAVYGLGVLNQIEAPVRFLTRAATVLRPQGLLFLTFECWNAAGPDVASGATGRTRIYNEDSWRKLLAEGRRAGFAPFGGMDWRYHGHALVDHTVASLVLTRR